MFHHHGPRILSSYLKSQFFTGKSAILIDFANISKQIRRQKVLKTSRSIILLSPHYFFTEFVSELNVTCSQKNLILLSSNLKGGLLTLTYLLKVQLIHLLCLFHMLERKN
jgi:hypothetical protein